MSQLISNLVGRFRSAVGNAAPTIPQATEPTMMEGLSEFSADNPWFIPPIGEIEESDHPRIYAYIDNLAYEASQSREEFLGYADSNRTIFTYGDDPPPPRKQVVSNEIQNSTIAIVDIQTREPIRCKLQCIQTGEKATAYWIGTAPQMEAVLNPVTGQPEPQMPFGLSEDQLGPWPDESGAMNPPNPLRPEQTKAIKQAIAAGAVESDSIVELSSKTISDAYQIYFDVYWTRSNIDRKLRSFITWNNIDGYVVWMYDFDAERRRYILRTTSLRQVYLDRTEEDIADANYAGIDLYMDLSEAKRLWPQYAKMMSQNAAYGGTPKVATSSGGGLPEPYDYAFKRPFVTLRIWWLRNQPIRLSMQEAIDAGHIQPNQRPVQPQLPSQPQATDTGLSDNEAAEGETAPPQNPAPDQQAISGAPVPMETYYTHSETGEEADVSGKLPYFRYTLRQTMCLVPVGVVVDDIECQKWDIPLVHSVCIPIPGKPFGHGEPFRQKNLQRGQSRGFTAVTEHLEYFAHPVTTMSESMYNVTQKAYGKAHVEPGATLIIPDQQYVAMNGKVHTQQEPPILSPGIVQSIQTLRQAQREDSGYTDSLRGIPTSSTESGRATQVRQDAASGQIGYKAQRTMDATYRLSRLMLHDLIHNVTVEEKSKMCRKYPPFIIQAMDRMAANEIEWDVNVTVSSGTRAVQQMKKAEAAQDLQLRAISTETYRDIAGIDNAVEIDRLKNEQQATLAQQQRLQQAVQPQQPPPQG